MTEISRREPRKFVDFSKVPPSQWKMHDRLLDWARSNYGGDKRSGQAGPMFVLYRSSDARREYGAETMVPINQADANLIGEGVKALPYGHREAINWYYVHGGRHPSGKAAHLNVTPEKLAELVIQGRYALIDMGV